MSESQTFPNIGIGFSFFEPKIIHDLLIGHSSSCAASACNSGDNGDKFLGLSAQFVRYKRTRGHVNLGSAFLFKFD